MVPKPDERRKYCKRTLSMESLQIYNKRPRLDPQIEFDNDSNDSFGSQSLQDLNEQFVSENFSLEKVVQMIFSSMSKLPNSMSSEFSREYGKYVDSGRVGQVDVLVKILASYLTEAGISPTSKGFQKKVEEIKTQEKEIEEEKDEREKVNITFFWYCLKTKTFLLH